MPARVQAAISAYAPSFKPWTLRDYVPFLYRQYKCSAHQLPYAVVGDFNGDGQRDLVIQGHTDLQSLTLAIVSPGSKVLEMSRGPLPDPEDWYGVGEQRQKGLWVYLSHCPPGVLKRSLGNQGPLVSRTDLFSFNLLGKLTTYYQYRNGAFAKVYVLD